MTPLNPEIPRSKDQPPAGPLRGTGPILPGRHDRPSSPGSDVRDRGIPSFRAITSSGRPWVTHLPVTEHSIQRGIGRKKGVEPRGIDEVSQDRASLDLLVVRLRSLHVSACRPPRQTAHRGIHAPDGTLRPLGTPLVLPIHYHGRSRYGPATPVDTKGHRIPADCIDIDPRLCLPGGNKFRRGDTRPRAQGSSLTYFTSHFTTTTSSTPPLPTSYHSGSQGSYARHGLVGSFEQQLAVAPHPPGNSSFPFMPPAGGPHTHPPSPRVFPPSRPGRARRPEPTPRGRPEARPPSCCEVSPWGRGHIP